MTLNRSNSSFTSYVDLDVVDSNGSSSPVIHPTLLTGESRLTYEDSVCHYSCQSSGKRQTIINEGKSSVLNDSNQNLSDKASKKVGNFFNNLTSLGGDTKEKVKLKVKPQQLKSMRKKLHRTPTPQPATDDVVLSRHFSQSCECTGVLFVTTLKVSFVAGYGPESEVEQGNKLFSSTDIPLSSIESVYELYGENADKKKKLAFGSILSGKIDGIFIRCKNFKFFKFNFKFAKVDAGRNIAIAILNHARPANQELLFGFENSLKIQGGGGDRHVSTDNTSWESFIKESECKKVKVSQANDTWQVSKTLPRRFVVPSPVSDVFLTRVGSLFKDNRPPVWVWGHRSGGSIYVQAPLLTEDSENLMKSYYNCHPKVYETEGRLPKMSQLEDSFTAMLDLHCLDSEKEIEDKDKSYFSSLENSGWLKTISATLQMASEVAYEVVNGSTVVIKDSDGRSTSLLVSSVAMVLMSPEFRTSEGLVELIQNCWIQLGYQFCSKHALTLPPPSARESKSSVPGVCPLFLMFLDCVHQLCHQFPSHLQFLPSYLQTIWDTALLSTTQTFMFDCEKDRIHARSASSASAFVWSLQFSPEQIQSWENPLYLIPVRPSRVHSITSDYSMIMDNKEGHKASPRFSDTRRVIPVSSNIVSLKVWHEMFHRSVPSLSKASSGEDKLTKVRREARNCIEGASSNTIHGNGLAKKNNHKR